MFGKNQSILISGDNSSYEYLREYGVYRVVILTQEGFDEVLLVIDFVDGLM